MEKTVSNIDSFKSFLVDEEEGNKKRKKIADTIYKVVKKKALGKPEEYDNATFIKFRCDSPECIKETIFEVTVAIDYWKRFARGMIRAVFITISKETNSHRNTDSMTIEVDRVSDHDFLKTLDSLKEYFKKLVEK